MCSSDLARSARKHIGWAVRALPGGLAFRAQMNTLDDPAAQQRAVADYFDRLAERPPVLPASNNDDDDAPAHPAAAARAERAAPLPCAA